MPKIKLLASAPKTWCGDALCPKTGCGCCNTCGYAGDEWCDRCGCGCRPDGTPKTASDYCPTGCKTIYGDNAEMAAEVEAYVTEIETRERAYQGRHCR